jgi:alpha-L-rhamnosidase
VLEQAIHYVKIFSHLATFTAISGSLCLASLSCQTQSKRSAIDLRCEHLVAPQGIDRPRPRLSWRMPAVAGITGQETSAYQLLVASSRQHLRDNTGDLWDSGRIEASQPVTIAYSGKPLSSLQDCYWKVKIWDEKGQEWAWSDIAKWSMGLVDSADWHGEWIGYIPPPDEHDMFRGEWFDPAHWIWLPKDHATSDGPERFRKDLDIPDISRVERAEMIVSATGPFRLYVNDQAVTSSPVPVDISGPIPRFDIASFLEQGKNQIELSVDHLGLKHANSKIKDVKGVIASIKLETQDDSIRTLTTDSSWLYKADGQKEWMPTKEMGGASTHWYHLPGWRQYHPSPLLRKTFHIAQTPVNAKLVIAGLGYYEAECNGNRIGNRVLDPAFTDYEDRVLYVCYDLKDRLETGDNVLGVHLGNGWYNMHTRATWNFDRAPWRDAPKVRAFLHMTFADGSQQIVATDSTWQANTGPLVYDSIRQGEVYDARLEWPGWTLADFDASAWPAAQIVRPPKGIPDAQVMPPMRVTETLVPQSITQPQPGIYVVDMGCNLAGWARISVSGPAGTKIKLRYSERLDPDGMINQTRNSRYMMQGAFQTDIYILKGEGKETWEPRFTYHGFRYVELTGWPGELTSEMIQGRFVHTDFESTGEFECSNPLLNSIYELTDRSYRSNFHGYPTDCPQREKNGWTGDAHLAAEQAMFNYQNLNAYDKWCRDLWDARTALGDLPGIVPTGGWGYSRANGPGWGSAAVLIPWYLYQYSGDKQFLRDHYDLMKGYVDFLHSEFPDHIVRMGRGDWVFLHTRTPSEVTSTALYYHNTGLLAKTAAVLKTGEEKKYQDLAANIRRAFHDAFYQGQGRYANAGQTAQSVSLFYGLVPDSLEDDVAQKLAEAVHKAEDHIDCGILGAKALFQTLSDHGYHELAYTVATQPDFPGYGDWIAQGATTLWEDWPDKEGSLNHVMLGDIVTWFFRSLAGINSDPGQPGFRHVIIQPRPVPDLSFVKAETMTPFGSLKCHWKQTKSLFELNVTLPPNSTATVIMPDSTIHNIQSGIHGFTCKKD